MNRQILLLTTIAIGFTSMAQVPSYVPTNGLVAWYPFQGNGNDASGMGNNATNNGATFVADRFGVAKSAGNFNGSTSFMSVAAPSFTLSYTGAFSYSVWIKKQTQPLAGIVLMTGSGASGNFISIIQGGTNQVFGTTMQGSSWTYLNCPHTLNTWDHYVGTYNAGTMNWYKNGVLQSSGTSPYTAAASLNLPLYIGKGIAAGNFLGAIDDIGIWDRALTPNEVTILYNSIPTAVSDMESEQAVSVAPNPASDHIAVHVNEQLIGAQYRLSDASGRVVLTGRISNSTTWLDVNRVPSGIYFVHLDSSQQSITERVVVQH
jgi:hypothetical protein